MKPFISSGGVWGKAFGIAAGVVTLFLTASGAKAQVLVTGFYNQVGSNYLYNFQVKNQTGLEVLVADIIIPGGNAFTITNELAPIGFQINVDAVTGRVGLVADSSTFLPNSTVNGFRLTSSGILPNNAVEVTDINGPAANGTFVSVAVPESGTLPMALLAGPVLVGVVVTRRRRNVSR